MENEVPYKDVLHKVDIPTETWPAQDIRKCHVMHIAAKCSIGERRAQFAAKAAYFFDRCLADLMSFDTHHLARPKVLLAAYGYVHSYFIKHDYGDVEINVLTTDHEFEFGSPQQFVPQRSLFQKLSWDRLPLVRKILKTRRKSDVALAGTRGSQNSK